jgi:hypothetical protein
MGELGRRLEPLLAEQRRLEERRSLLEGLLRSFDHTNGPKPQSETPVGSVGEYVVAKATEILREQGEPMNINDLHARFLERGYLIPGAGKTVNLIVHLRGADGIVSPGRGMYSLPEHGQPEAPRPRRRRKRSTTKTRRARG